MKNMMTITFFFFSRWSVGRLDWKGNLSWKTMIPNTPGWTDCCRPMLISQMWCNYYQTYSWLEVDLLAKLGWKWGECCFLITMFLLLLPAVSFQSLLGDAALDFGRRCWFGVFGPYEGKRKLSSLYGSSNSGRGCERLNERLNALFFKLLWNVCQMNVKSLNAGKSFGCIYTN